MIFSYTNGRYKHYLYNRLVIVFFSKDFKQLNAIEGIIKLQLKRDIFVENRKGTDNLFTICRQINEIEKLLAKNVSEKNYGEVIN